MIPLQTQENRVQHCDLPISRNGFIQGTLDNLQCFAFQKRAFLENKMQPLIEKTWEGTPKRTRVNWSEQGGSNREGWDPLRMTFLQKAHLVNSRESSNHFNFIPSPYLHPNVPQPFSEDLLPLYYNFMF